MEVLALNKMSRYQLIKRLLGLVKPLLKIIIPAILFGVAGFLCSIFIPVLGGYGILEAAGFDRVISWKTILILLPLLGALRGILRYAEQYSNHLLAFMTLTSPLLGQRQIKRGDEVITVACGFPTTVTPILQYGAVPVFVDVTIPQYNIDVEKLEAAFSAKTKAVMIAHTLGNPFDLKTVKEFCIKNNLWLIEDNCDALGSEYILDGITRKTGTIGDIGTSSFYPPHHMTMGEGGAVYTKNPLLNKIIRSMRDWGRDCVCASGQDNRCGHRFDKQYGQLPFGYDHKYVYSHLGYNLKATDMQAAIGVAQIKKIPEFVNKRRKNWLYLHNCLEDLKNELILPEALTNSNPSWFGFMITCKTNEERNKIVEKLETAKIQTRALFAGNLIRHPCFDQIRNTDEYRVIGSLENTDRIMNNSFWVGVYPGMTNEMLDCISQVIHSGLQ